MQRSCDQHRLIGPCPASGVHGSHLRPGEVHCQALRPSRSGNAGRPPRRVDGTFHRRQSSGATRMNDASLRARMRGLAAFVALIILVLGSPAALVAWGRLDATTLLRPSGWLTPDDGMILLGIATVVGCLHGLCGLGDRRTGDQSASPHQASRAGHSSEHRCRTTRGEPDSPVPSDALGRSSHPGADRGDGCRDAAACRRGAGEC